MFDKLQLVVYLRRSQSRAGDKLKFVEQGLGSRRVEPDAFINLAQRERAAYGN